MDAKPDPDPYRLDRFVTAQQPVWAQVLDAQEIFGSPDDLKLRSCLTLFDQAAEGDGPFDAALARFYDGRPDEAALALLSTPRSSNGTSA